jgi:hypothetical protein
MDKKVKIKDLNISPNQMVRIEYDTYAISKGIIQEVSQFVEGPYKDFVENEDYRIFLSFLEIYEIQARNNVIVLMADLPLEIYESFNYNRFNHTCIFNGQEDEDLSEDEVNEKEYDYSLIEKVRSKISNLPLETDSFNLNHLLNGQEDEDLSKDEVNEKEDDDALIKKTRNKIINEAFVFDEFGNVVSGNFGLILNILKEAEFDAMHRNNKDGKCTVE